MVSVESENKLPVPWNLKLDVPDTVLILSPNPPFKYTSLPFITPFLTVNKVPVLSKSPITHSGVDKVIHVSSLVEKLKKLVPVLLDNGGDNEVDPLVLTVVVPNVVNVDPDIVVIVPDEYIKFVLRTLKFPKV